MFVPASSFHGSMSSNGGRAVSCTCRVVNNSIIVYFFWPKFYFVYIYIFFVDEKCGVHTTVSMTS